MSEHIATLLWSLGDADFDIKTFSRNHQWDLGHGLEVPASSAPDFGGDETRCDPEQAFVAALSSCHSVNCEILTHLE